MSAEVFEASKYWTERTTHPLNRAIAELADRQHGRVALRQLRELGLSASAVRSRVGTGSLRQVHRGVYAVGNAVATAKTNWMAAVLACGPGAALSHASAGALAEIRHSAGALIDVTVPSQAGRKLAGIRVHMANLAPEEVTVIDGIRCTTFARTLLDLAAVLDRQGLEKAINRAEIRQVFDLRAIEECLDRAGHRRGTRALRETLTYLNPLSAKTRNELEQAFLDSCRRAGLPLPEVNEWLTIDGHWFQPDFLWRSHRLIVETDGWETHSTRRAFESDRRRDLILLRAHYHTVRVTWRQVFDAWREIDAALRPLLA